MGRAGNFDTVVLIRAGRATRRAFVAGSLLASAGASIWSAAADAKYPERPIRIILPFGTGSVVDLTTRLVVDRLGQKLGQRFLVESMPGPGGTAAARATLQAHSDGYTITMVTCSTAVSLSLIY